MSADLKPSLYLETTIPSYLAARTSNDIRIAGKQATTHDFWESERHKYNLYVSLFVHEECGNGDPNVAKKRLALLNDIEILLTTPDVEPLADVYMRLLSIPQKSKVDALHLAICSVYGIDILLTWNCTHLGTANMLRILKHNETHGLHTPQLITPDSIVGKYKEVDFNE